MSIAAREQFLADVHVGILSVTALDGGGPLTAPVWYSYQPGGRLSVITGRNSRKAQCARTSGRVSLCAQVESPPYRYVTVEGPVVIEEVDAAERLAMARRYLGTEGGDQYVASVPDPDGENIVIRISPQRWLSADYGQHGE
jgi:PPOX class probable F420-dependent enzyme